jgi:hypothetical protein
MNLWKVGLPALVIAIAVGGAEAAINVNGTGLSNPAQTITFDEHVFPNLTSLTTEYSDLGVTFSPNLYYHTTSYPPGEFPNIHFPYLANFANSETPVDPFVLRFLQPQTDVAFAISNNWGLIDFTTFLRGAVVETRAFWGTPTNTIDFYVFSGKQIDEIEMHVDAYFTWMCLDNIQTGHAIPEPSTLIVWSLLGASGIAVGWWRRRRAGA